MQGNHVDVAQAKDSASVQVDSERDALINRIAAEMCCSKSDSLLSFDSAPENIGDRYGLAALKGIANLPRGIANAVHHDINHPLEILETIGTGAATAVVLKAVLPESGLTGKIAGAALGTYFMWQAAKPVIAGFKNAGSATTIKDLDLAAAQIGDAGGAFIVNSAVAAAGYRLGGAFADSVFAQQIRDSLVAGVKSTPGINQEAHSMIPQYSVEEIGKYGSEPPEPAGVHRQASDAKIHQTAGMIPSGQEDFHGAREVYDAGQKWQPPFEKARFEGENPTGNADVDRAYDLTGTVRDFYLKEFGRNSIDGRGMKIVSVVNFGKGYNNAGWVGTQMIFGRPLENNPRDPIKSLMKLDVVGHEITHAISVAESGLGKKGQAGIINEHISDAFGSMIKQWVKGQTADQADWLIGDGVFKDNINGRGMRDMLNPGTAYDDPLLGGKDPQPADMAHYVKTYGDNGGVHVNSGIPNRAFALFARAAGGYAWEDPGHIWFAARKAAGSNPSFAQFAFQTVEAARAFGKADLVSKLEQAWATVGITPDANAVDNLTPPLGRRFGMPNF